MEIVPEWVRKGGGRRCGRAFWKDGGRMDETALERSKGGTTSMAWAGHGEASSAIISRLGDRSSDDGDFRGAKVEMRGN